METAPLSSAAPGRSLVALCILIMPAYTTSSCSLDKRDRAGLARAFYSSFFGDSVAFDGVLPWGCDADLTLDQIIEWNQNGLDADFTLGFEQHVSHDYRQIVLFVRPFSKCRLILSNDEIGIAFQSIVPEREINPTYSDSLERACCRTWSRLPVRAVESYGEIGADVGFAAIASGELQSADLFAKAIGSNRASSKVAPAAEWDSELPRRVCRPHPSA